VTGLAAFRDPASVVVVGASTNPAKWGHWLARGALLGASRRSVHLVNARGGSVLGAATVPSLADLPSTPDLAAFAVPAAALPAAVDEALTLGVKGLLVITAGVPRPEELARKARAAGARLIGPNCLGLYDADTSLALAWGEFQAGALAIVSQSGQLGSELSGLAAAAGIGVSRFVSVGDQADVAAHEILADLVDHDATRVVAVYLESFGDGARLLAALEALRLAGKPVLLLTIGASRAAQDAARSHTGALTTSLDVVDAACRAAGALRVDTPAALVNAAQLVVRAPRVRGRRVAIVGDSGGQGALAADIAASAGLDVVAFPEPVRDTLRRHLPAGAAVANPVDLAGVGEQDIANYQRLVAVVTASKAVDAVLMTGYFGCYARDIPAQAGEEAEAALGICAASAAAGIPVAVHSMAEGTATITALRAGGAPTYLTVEAAVTAIATAAEIAALPARGPAAPAGEVTAIAGLPPHAYDAARRLLAGAGVAFPPARLVHDERELAAAAAELCAPYALKAEWLEHKSEHGGVDIDLADLAAVRAAFAGMRDRLGPGGYVLEEMDTRPHAIEMIVGARRDPAFGPVVLVGAGGVEAELLQDTAVDLADLNRERALTMIRRLRCLPLLQGWRGRPAVDVEGLAEVILAVAGVMRAYPDLLDLELNPVRVAPDGVIAVDALVRPHDDRRCSYRELPSTEVDGA
jgi:acyl-CoA synthetase (NDP forming)